MVAELAESESEFESGSLNGLEANGTPVGVLANLVGEVVDGRQAVDVPPANGHRHRPWVSPSVPAEQIDEDSIGSTIEAPIRSDEFSEHRCS